MSEYFSEPKSLGKVKIVLDLPNRAKKKKKNKIKKCNRNWCIIFSKKVDLASLKSNDDKLDINRLKNLPTNINLKSKIDKLDVDK